MHVSDVSGDMNNRAGEIVLEPPPGGDDEVDAESVMGDVTSQLGGERKRPPRRLLNSLTAVP